MMNATSQLTATAAEVARRTRAPLHEDEPATLVEMFLQAAREHTKPDALSYKRDGAWRSISSEEMITRTRVIALGLYSLGIRHGERVGLLSQNCPEWTLSDAGTLFAGAVNVPIYTTQTPSQVSYILQDSGARVLFIENRASFERVREAISECHTLEQVIFFDASEVEESRHVALSDLEARGRRLLEAQPGLITELERKVKEQDLATIIYTSGTTGEPKGVMLTHSNLVSNLIDSSGHLSFSEEDIALSVLPLSHVLERLAMYMYIHHGMSVYYAESLEKVGANFREVRPSIFVGVPRLYEKIYQRIKERAASEGKMKAAILAWAVAVGKLRARFELNHQPVPRLLAFKNRIAQRLVFHKWREGLGGRIRLFVSGGAALSDEIGYIFTGAGLPIVQGYGLTETSPVISAGTLEDNRIGTVGRPIRNVEVRIAPDGEIETRGPNVMLGYYNKPEETRVAFTEDGWFKTGDIGTLDEDGFLRITDRKKELFKTSGGKYIAPQPIEQLIKGSRFVNQVVLIGNERKFPSALIVPDWEQLQSYAQLKGLEARTPTELIKHPRIVNLFERQVNAFTEELAQFEKVKRIALLDHELTIEGGELTPTLKVKRRVVDEKYRDIIDRLYEEAEKQ
jgi:long-chain acyl-CoA synthetase